MSKIQKRREFLIASAAGVSSSVLWWINPAYAQIGLAPGFWKSNVPALGPMRVSMNYVEAVWSGQMDFRVTQTYLETIYIGSADAQVSLSYVEALYVGAPDLLVTLSSTEVLYIGTPDARVSLNYLEVLRSDP